MSVHFIIHGCPSGQQSTATNADPAEFRAYADFHTGNGKHIDFPSKPGEKFIKETLKSGSLAYTFVRTGVYEANSSRPGSNYAAITLFFDDKTRISNEKEFLQQLKQWFEINVLNRFTVDLNGDWKQWTNDADYYVFRNKMDAQFSQSLMQLLTPYVSTTKNTTNDAKTDALNNVTKKLRDEIQNLEQAKQEIQQKLEQKYTELKNLSKTK